MKSKMTTQVLTELALFAAIAFVLDYFQSYFCDFLGFWPNGGSVGISMCAVFFICFRRGPIGLLLGFIVGLLDMMDGVWISPLADTWYNVFFQLGLDYFVGWTLVGLAGLFAKSIKSSDGKKKIILIITAVFIGSTAKFLSHFAAGMLFWPNSDVTSQFIYSFTYNLSYMGPSFILCSILMVLMTLKQPKLLSPEGGK